MFCGNCGAQITGHGKFCAACGTGVIYSAPEGNLIAEHTVNKLDRPMEIVDKRKTAKHQMKMRRVTVGVVLAVICVVLIITERSSYQRVVYDYFKAYENADAEKFLSSVPDFQREYDEEGYMSGERTRSTQRYLDECMDRWEECGSNISITYDIQNKTRATQSDLDELENFFENRYNCEALSITDAYALEVDFRVSGSLDQIDYEGTMLLIKENGKWRIVTGYIDTEYYRGYGAGFSRDY